jgi:hypothetical protein
VQPQLEGPPPDAVRLRREIAGLEQELREAKSEAETAKQSATDAVQAIRALRNQLEPFYKALKMVFGEITRVEAENVLESGQPRSQSASNPKWESWKKKLGGKQAEFIDALLEHGGMTGAQLKVATRCAQGTLYDTIARLNKAQLINKNGGKFSLKES